MHRVLPTLLGLTIACASTESMAAADLIITHAKVYTAEPGQALQQAVAIEDGKILKVGSNSEMEALADAGTQRINLAGKVLMPGMIDTHSHPVMAALDSLGANLYDELLPLEQFEQWLIEEEKAGRAKHQGVVLVSGMNSSYWEQAEGLGQRFNQGRWQDVPVVLSGIDGHTGWANNAMLKRVGIDAAMVKAQPEKERSFIGHSADFTPNGYLAETAWDLVRSQLPAADDELMLQAARKAVAVNNSVGVTAWMDAAANGGVGASLFEMRPTEQDLGVLPLYRSLSEKGELSAHVAALLLAHPQSLPKDLEVQAKVMQQFANVPNLTFPGIKIFLDGIMEFPGQTAAMLDPFKNSLKRGQLLIDPATFPKLVEAAEQRGWIVHMHAVGDRAVREGLNAVANARQLSPAPVPHSISHLQTVNPKEFPRFRELGVIASMQLLWATAETYTEELVKPYVSAMAYQYQYPARSLNKAGATIAGASDWPVSSPNPWNAIAQASTRKGPLGVLNAAESIDRQSMFQAYTLNAAKALRLEQRIGSIAPGKQADLIVLDRDVFTVSDAELFDTQVVTTYFAGKPVYQAPTDNSVAQAQ